MLRIRASRNAEFGALQEKFLVTAAATILIIRTDLWLTNYPQLGGSGLHIAHLLWGGLFMVGAIGVLVTFLGRNARHTAIVVGGVGFGFFIDELGKFITSDNNYFYEPAAALIYLIFITLFLGSRAMRRRRHHLSPAERLSNVVELVGEAARGHFDELDRARALALLDATDEREPLVEPLRRLMAELDALPPRPPGRLARAGAKLSAGLQTLVGRTSTRHAIGWVFAAWSVLSLVTVSELVLELALAEGGHASGFESDALADLTFVNIASLASGLVSAALVGIGLVRLWRGSALEAYRTFQRAAIVAIFVTRVFVFVESQFAAVIGLALDVLLLVTASAAVRREQQRAGPTPAATAAEHRLVA